MNIGDLFTGGCQYGNDAMVGQGLLDKEIDGDSVKYFSSSPLDMFILVGDDYKYLPNAVDSLYHICGRLIIVQTSNKFRMEDVINLNDYPRIVHRYQPWVNSYSVARNFALLFVRPKAKWIGYIDCDERIVNANKALDIIKAQPDDVGALIISIIGPHHYEEGNRIIEGTNIRFFRAWHNYYFIHGIHEQIGASIKVSGKKALVIKKEESYIAHLGYDLTSEEMLAKTMKYRALLNIDKENYPHDGAVYYHSAKNYSMLNVDQLAVKDYATAITLLSTSDAVKAECYGALAGYANKQNEHKNAADLALKGLRLSTKNYLCSFNLAFAKFKMKEYPIAKRVLEIADLGRADAKQGRQLLILLERICNGQANANPELGDNQSGPAETKPRLDNPAPGDGDPLQDWHSYKRGTRSLFSEDEACGHS